MKKLCALVIAAAALGLGNGCGSQPAKNIDANMLDQAARERFAAEQKKVVDEEKAHFERQSGDGTNAPMGEP